MTIEIIAPTDGDVKSGRKKSRRKKSGGPDRGTINNINIDECNDEGWQARHPGLSQEQQHDIFRIVCMSAFRSVSAGQG